MAFSLRKLMGDKKYEESLRNRERIAKRRQEFAAMSDEEMADSLSYTFLNSTLTRFTTLTTYDEALALVFIPELLRKLRGGKDEGKNKNYDELRKRVEARIDNNNNQGE